VVQFVNVSEIGRKNRGVISNLTKFRRCYIYTKYT
jgi:hypothetical protein